jgi:integrase
MVITDHGFLGTAVDPAGPAMDVLGSADAVVRGLHFHDLRNTHRTWLIEDGVPEAAQAKRLGHRLPGVRRIYGHVSATVEQRLAEPRRRSRALVTSPSLVDWFSLCWTT